MIGRATSPEAIARLGRVVRSYIITDLDWREVLASKGPMPAQRIPFLGRNPSTQDRKKKTHAEPWLGVRPLRILVSGSLMSSGDPEMKRILELSRLEDVDIDVLAPHAEPPETVGVLSFDGLPAEVEAPPCVLPEGVHWLAVKSTREPGAEFGLIMEGGGHHAMEYWMVPEGESRQVALSTCWELKIQQTLDYDIYVVESAALLRNRNSWNWSIGKGICSPREALTLIENCLRSRGVFMLDVTAGSLYLTDSSNFYWHLAAARIPRVIAAYKSCLAPTRRQDYEDVAERIEAITTRFADLWIACHNLDRLAYSEGFVGGDNQIAGEQLYHLQNAIVLVSGCLDAISRVANELGGIGISESRQDWPKMTDAQKGRRDWARIPENSPVAKIRDACREHPFKAVADFVYELRSCYQHRHPLRAGIARFLDKSLTRAAYTIVDLNETLGERIGDVLPRHKVSGIESFHESLFLVPHVFLRTVVNGLAELMDCAFAVVEWPMADWLQDDSMDIARRERCDWLFG